MPGDSPGAPAGRLQRPALAPAADYLLVDAMTIDTPLPQESLIKGDARCCSIAAASIVAKVERDRWLVDWDARYPGYGLASNKGYATADHLRALARLGPTAGGCKDTPRISARVEQHLATGDRIRW